MLSVHSESRESSVVPEVAIARRGASASRSTEHGAPSDAARIVVERDVEAAALGGADDAELGQLVAQLARQGGRIDVVAGGRDEEHGGTRALQHVAQLGPRATHRGPAGR